MLVCSSKASSLISPIPLYGNNCEGSSVCSSYNIGSDCQGGLALINQGATYNDQAQFSNGHCYIIYATNGEGAQPISGSTIHSTASAIISNCGHHCGSYGTNNCPNCHVTVNYRS
ncbi:hypothetical protein OE88DRAFT_1637690 [Heliocybe sulcata]|uniref:Uncharacterized protein n=1 Tax=Heliocybe sulcata TaxID=5364 RepID=A0A5C3MP98_9AGAM|nr:hypothetical protein OE88DRAFT_1637690 [Heliocybe sulcata]